MNTQQNRVSKETDEVQQTKSDLDPVTSNSTQRLRFQLHSSGAATQPRHGQVPHNLGFGHL